MIFNNRADAGRRLARALEKFRGEKVIVYALPRGGTVVAAPVARRLSAPLDLVITRKITHPEFPEYAICAVSENDFRICNEEEMAVTDPDWLEGQFTLALGEIKRRRRIYRGGKNIKSPKGKVAIVIDDGIATGLTMQAALEDIRHLEPKKLVLAVPVIPFEVAEAFRPKVDEIIALSAPVQFLRSVGSYYLHFPQVTDEEVVRILSNYL